MTKTSNRPDPSSGVTELEFELNGCCHLCEASAETAGAVELEFVIPQSNGDILQHGTVCGSDPDRVMKALQRIETIRDVTILKSVENRVHFEVVTTNSLGQTLADQGALVTDLTAKDGRGRLVVDVPPHVDPRSVVARFVDEFPDASLAAKRHTDRQFPKGGTQAFIDDVLTDLTDRQEEVLRTAQREGYFESPRSAPASEIAETLGISSPTFSQHLRAAQKKIFNRIFPDP